jgi:MFS family permease
MIASVLAPYRRILSRPGTALFSLTGLVARLPISMVGIGIVLLVEHETGSYAFAGAVSAVTVIANAVCAIGWGALMDRFGQGRVLLTSITLWGVGLALTMWSVLAGWPAPATYLFAALAGASLPSVGTCVRARWSASLDEPGELQTAYAFEAVADEVVFMSGPIIVTMLATLAHPAAGLAAALGFGLVGTYVFAAQRRTAPAPHPAPKAGTRRAAMPWHTIAPLTLVSAALGLLFGGAEVATVGFADEQGHQSAAGFLLAVLALGSLAAGAVTGAVAWRSGPLGRLRWGALGLALATAPLVVVPSIPVMFGVLLVGGLAIAPTLIAAMSLAEQVLPRARLTEGMAYIQTGLMAGIAPGAALAGVVIDEYGASASYLVCFAGGALALVGTLLTRTPRTATVRSHEVESRGEHHLA